MHVCALSAKKKKRGVALPVTNIRALFVPAIIFLSVTIIDQITKIWAVDFLSIKGSVEVLGRFLMLTLTYNQGGALGTSFGPSIYYLIASVLILAFILYYIFIHRTDREITFPLSFIAGGALGNIVDRIRIEKVVDWIDVDFFNLNILGYQLDRWWTFNLADAAISCAIVYILITMLLSKFSSPEKNQNSVTNDPSDITSSSVQ